MTTSLEKRIEELPLKIQKDIINLYQAEEQAEKYLKFCNNKKFRIPGNFFLMIHKTLLKRKIKNAGVYRNASKRLKIPQNSFKIPEAWEVMHKVVDLVELLNNKRRWFAIFKNNLINKSSRYKNLSKEESKLLYGIFMAWYFHHQFTIIHPFSDGNGRTARILMCLILKEQRIINPVLPLFINETIRRCKNDYLDALNKADKGNYEEGVSFLIDIIVKSTIELEKFLKEQKSEFSKKIHIKQKIKQNKQ